MKLGLWSVSALALAAAAWTPAFAQSATVAANDAGAVDAIIVTGTRSTSRTVTESLAPIDVLPATELIKSGKQSPRDLIATLVPSASTSNSGAGASFAVKTVSLRGLSADQTLVLINGKRRHNTAILFVNGTTQNGQSPPDLDLIPSSAISRVEVLRDGASAQYGSDALAGVINIILKNTDSGGSASALWGKTFDGDGETGQLSGNIGLRLGPEGGFLNLSVDGRTQDRTDRGGPNTSVLYPLINGKPDPREATANRYVNHPGQPAIQVYSFGYDAGVPITDKINFYSFGTMTSRDSSAYLTYRNPNASNNNINVYPNGYVPNLHLHDRDFQYTGGFKGSDLYGWTWDLSTSFARDRVDYYETSALNASLGPASPTNFYIGQLLSQEWTSNFDVTKELNTGLFAKPLFAAAGAEYRKNTFTVAAGEPASYVSGGYVAPSGPLAGVITQGGSQGVSGFPASAAGSWSRNNYSLYLNLEQSVTQQLEFSVAGRHEHYSDFGNADTAKVSTRYEPIEGVAFRGTASTGFRAPSLQQEHYASSSTIGVIIPPSVVTQLYPVQLLPPDTAAAKALGAAPLQPEKSVNYSVGLVLQPVRRMNVTLDVYQIKIDNRILQTGTLGPSAVVSNALAAQGLNPQQAVFYYANAADTRTRGVDFVADYRSDFGDFGTVKWTFSANFNRTKFLRVETPPPALAAAGLVLIDRVKIGDFTRGTPRDKFILSGDWRLGKFDTNLRLTRFGRVTQTSTLPINDDVISPRLTVDLDVTYNFTDKLSFTLGANNLLNAYPDILKPNNQGTTGFSYYNPYSPYGISGGFYYGRLSFQF